MCKKKKPPDRRQMLTDCSTAELVQELKKREAVDSHVIEPYQDFSMTVNGPVIILVIRD